MSNPIKAIRARLIGFMAVGAILLAIGMVIAGAFNTMPVFFGFAGGINFAIGIAGWLFLTEKIKERSK